MQYSYYEMLCFLARSKVQIPSSTVSLFPHLLDSVIIPQPLISYAMQNRSRWYGVHVGRVIEFSHAVVYTRHGTDCPGVTNCCE